MRKVLLEVKVKLVINADDDIEVSEIVNEMEYLFQDTTTKADIENTEILDYEILDSK